MTTSRQLVGTRDWDAAHRAVADVYFPHELTALDEPEKVNLSLRTVELGGVTIGRMSWGTAVSIACEYPGAYEVNIPLSGRLHSRAGDGEIVSRPGLGTIFAAGRASLITNWTADCQVIGVKFDAEHLEREADRIHLTPIRRRLSLPDQLDVSSAAGASWLSLVTALSAQPRDPVDLLANPLVGPQLASAVTTAFLLAVTPDDADSDGQLRPGMVKRVLDALNDDPAHPWTSAEMAALAGTSVRRLQEAFAEFVETTPTRALADIRLDRARDDLARGHGTVADAAARWGFSSPSRFAAAYRRRYGVSPSQVLRH
ncbi:AraC family transcriptional regulator [Gordonia rhizosphera]|uniref:Putative AraC family transcriptional regulator n=1 Tax=Gordonia rhizosphera NBRC 16068 TaxID=1108045 RepID=K6WN48_9ACTN|nr:AraC family transcriptional regulator [Gordonia rhizosphera]GAB93572.1 putative AraC family transcriptional regulator [Gordonia rhizosphera NBRC 16068]